MPSYVKCVICGGWGGEWGESQGGRAICYQCWSKGHRRILLFLLSIFKQIF